MMGGRPAKPNVKPRTKMRGLPWQVLPPIKVNDTFWEKVDESKIMSQLPRKDLEKLFAAKITKDKSLFKRKKAHEKPKELSLLDGKRANNVTIMMSRFKLPLTQIRKALIAVDLEVFSLDNLMLMQPFLPTDEERLVLEGYEGDRGILGRAERLFLELMQVPNLELRFDALLFRGTFEDKYERLHRQVTSVIHALDSLQNSELFKEILKIILALGNYLNGGSFRGGAYGFKLSTLDSLLNFKANDGSTMIEFLVKYVKKKHKKVMKWTQEVAIVTEVIDVNMGQVQLDAASLIKNLAVAKRARDADSPLPEDGLRAAMTPFIERVEPMVGQLEKDAAEMNDKFVAVCKYYGDERKPEESEEFFQMIDGFIRAFKGTDRRLRLAKEKKKREKSRPKPPPRKSKPTPGQPGDKKALLSRLQKSPRNSARPPTPPKK